MHTMHSVQLPCCTRGISLHLTALYATIGAVIVALVRMRFAGSIPAISSQTQSEMTGFLLCLAAKLQDLVPRASFEGIAAFFVLIYHKSHHNPGMFQVFPSTICTRKRTITNYITKSRPYRWLPTSFGPHLAGCGCSGSSQMCREGDGGKNMSVSQ